MEDTALSGGCVSLASSLGNASRETETETDVLSAAVTGGDEQLF